MGKGLSAGGHENPIMKTDIWLTPPYILKALGEFDLDPCASSVRPWNTARFYYTKEDNGLARTWSGRVWCNPPYGKEAEKWLNKLANHGNGIALIFARTETKSFFRYVWQKADAVLFLKGRLHFYNEKGEQARGNAGAPSCLVAYGQVNARALFLCELEGRFVPLSPYANTLC